VVRAVTCFKIFIPKVAISDMALIRFQGELAKALFHAGHPIDAALFEEPAFEKNGKTLYLTERAATIADANNIEWRPWIVEENVRLTDPSKLTFLLGDFQFFNTD